MTSRLLASLAVATTTVTHLTSSSAGGAPPYDVAASTKHVIAAYQSFDYTKCPATNDCARTFEQATGIESIEAEHHNLYEFNPARSMPNPDPEWLPGWNRLPKDDGPLKAIQVFRALALARVRKTWHAKCDADYAELDKHVRASDAQMSDAIAKATAEANPYARIGDLLALRASVIGALPQESVVGARYTLELAIRDAFRTTGRDYLWTLGGYAPSRELAKMLRPRQDGAFERDVYCAAAIGGNATTPLMPEVEAYVSDIKFAVKPVIDPSRLAELDGKLAELAQASEQELATVHLDDPLSAEASPPGHPKLVHTRETATVTSFKAVGDGLAIELVDTFNGDFPIAGTCSRTNRISKIDDDGSVHYQENCQFGHQSLERHFTLQLAAAPPGLTLAKDERVHFDLYGVVTATKDTTPVNTRTRVVRKFSETIAVDHVAEIGSLRFWTVTNEPPPSSPASRVAPHAHRRGGR